MVTISPNVVRSLGEKAMVSRLSISKFGNQKFDRKISRETNIRLGAEADSGRYNKPLVNRKAPAMVRVTKTYGLLRKYHSDYTIPYDDNGGRLLAATHYTDFCRDLRGYIEAFEQASRDFIDAWDRLVDEAEKKHLGSRVFKRSEYPTKDELKDMFGVRHSFEVVPSGGNAYDIRDISDDDRERIAKAIDTQVGEKLQDSMREPWKRLHDAVARVVDTLSDPEKGFHKTMITKLVDLVNVMPALNIGEDPNLDSLTNDIRNSLVHFDITDLKSDKYYRQDAAADAQKILDDMGAFFTP